MIPNPAVKNNSMVGTNSKSQYCWRQVKFLGYTIFAKDVMPLNCNEAVCTSESCSNVASVVPKSDVNSNPKVAMNPEVSSVQDNSSCFDSPFFQSTVMPTNENEAVTTSESGSVWLQLLQNQLSTAILQL